MDYYNQWWNNSGGNNWYMDQQHKPALNQPPPAHNMSGPPQHPPPHGMNMPVGQPLPPRAMQPEYMLPRPAHTGSPVGMAPKQSQPSSVSGPKIQHPGGSSSPKPLSSSNTPQDKSGMANTPTPSNLPMTTAAKASSIPPLIPATDSSKQIHSMPQQQQSYHQLNQMHQQRPVQPMMPSQQQQAPLQQQQQQALQQQQHQQPQLHQQPMPNQQINVPQQQMQINQLPTQQNLQQLPSTAVQQHNQLLQNVVTAPKQDTPKGPTPPLPGLISISSKQPLTTQTLPPSPKTTAENKPSSASQIPNSEVQKLLPPISNSAVAIAPIKPVPSPSPVAAPSSISNNASTPSAIAPVPIEPPKAVNVSITPAKPIIVAQKPEPSKTLQIGHTVTITPSIKPSETTESKVNDATKSASDPIPNAIPAASEPNLNGVSSNKSLIKPIITPNASKPIDPLPSDKMPASLALKSSPVNSAATPTRTNQHSIPFPKQSPTAPTPKQSSIQPISVKPAAALSTPTKPPAPASSKPVAPASPKPPAPASPKPPAPASPKLTAPSSPKLAPVTPKPPVAAPVTPKPPVAVSPLKPSLVTPVAPQMNQSASNVNQQSPPKPVTPVAISSPTKSANLKLSPQPVTPQLPNQPHNSTNASSKSAVCPPLNLLSSLQKTPAQIPSAKQNEILQTKTQEKSKLETAPIKPVVEKIESQSAKRAKPAPPVTKKSAKTPTPARQPRIRKLVETPPKSTDLDTFADKIESSSKSEEVEETPRRAARTKRKVSETPSEGERKSKRSRNPATIYQSPIPDIITRVTRNITSTLKSPQEKLVYFFKNEHVALRNAEGTFYLCQIAQNVYKSTKKIKIRWLSPVDEKDKECDAYKPDYYDITDFDCILTSVALQKGEKSVMKLPAEERKRILNILQRAMDRDKGISPEKAELVEDHPDGLDLSLYNDESQLKKRKRKGRKLTEGTTSDESGVESGDDGEDVKKDIDDDEEEVEKANTTLRQKTSIKKDISVVKGDEVVEKNAALKGSDKKCYKDDDDEEEEDDEDDDESEEEDSEEDEPPKKVSRTMAGGKKSTRGAPGSRGRGVAAAKAANSAPITTSTPRRGARKAPTPRGSTRNNRITPETSPASVSEKKENVKLEVASKQEDTDELPAKSSRNPRGAAKPPLPKETTSPSTKMTRRSRK